MTTPGLPRAPLLPLLVGAAGIAVLCAMDAVIKHLGQAHPVATVTFGRYALGLIAASAVWTARGRPSIGPAALRPHALRGLVIAISAFLFFWALSVLTLAETVTIAFVAPLLIPVAAHLVLGERMRSTSIVAGIVGFAGALVAVQGAPDAADTPQRTLGIAAALGSAVTYALSAVLLRARAAIDGVVVVGVMAALFPALFMAPFAAAAGGWPTGAASAWFVAMGLLGTLGIYLLSWAYARAEAQVLAPLEFTALGWAALIGALFFREHVRLQVWAGAAIIIGACLFAAWDQRRRAAAPLA